MCIKSGKWHFCAWTRKLQREPQANAAYAWKHKSHFPLETHILFFIRPVLKDWFFTNLFRYFVHYSWHFVGAYCQLFGWLWTRYQGNFIRKHSEKLTFCFRAAMKFFRSLIGKRQLSVTSWQLENQSFNGGRIKKYL